VITCIAINTDLGIVASGSADKTCIISSTEGRYIRTLHHKSTVDLVKISNRGDIVTYCFKLSKLYCYDINGRLQKELKVNELTHMLITRDGKFLVTADSNGVLCIRNVEDLDLVEQYEATESKIRSLAFAYGEEGERYLFAGLQEGKLSIFVFDPKPIIARTSENFPTSAIETPSSNYITLIQKVNKINQN